MMNYDLFKEVVAEKFNNNLSDDNKEFLSEKKVDGVTRFQGNFLNHNMNVWYKENCK